MFDRIIGMILNQFIRRGVSAAINRVTAPKPGPKPGTPALPLSAADKAQARTARDAAKRARQAAKLTRRMR